MINEFKKIIENGDLEILNKSSTFFVLKVNKKYDCISKFNSIDNNRDKEFSYILADNIICSYIKENREIFKTIKRKDIQKVYELSGRNSYGVEKISPKLKQLVDDCIKFIDLLSKEIKNENTRMDFKNVSCRKLGFHISFQVESYYLENDNFFKKLIRKAKKTL